MLSCSGRNGQPRPAPGDYAPTPAKEIEAGATSQEGRVGKSTATSETGPCIKLFTGGSFIGMFEQFSYEQETIRMQPGDLLVAYTDGVTEANNVSGEEFGEARLQEMLASVAHLPADEIRNEVVREVREWCAGAPQYDDLTFVVLKVKQPLCDGAVRGA